MFGTDFDKMFRFPPPKLIEEKSVNFGDWKLKHPDSFKFLKICKNDEFQNQSDFSQIRTEKHNNAMKKLSIMAQKLNKIEDKVEEDLKLQEEKYHNLEKPVLYYSDPETDLLVREYLYIRRKYYKKLFVIFLTI